MNSLDVAIIGAGGAVGEALREALEERAFPVGQLHLLDAGEAVGERLLFRDRRVPVKAVGDFGFSPEVLVFFAGDTDLAPFGEQAAMAGCTVIDAIGTLAGEGDPLVVADVNSQLLPTFGEGGIIGTPSASAAALAVALKPLREAAGLVRVDVVSLQSVSARGRAGVEELASQTAKLLNAMPVENRVFSRQIAFNILPNVGSIDADGFTPEEWRLAHELRQVLEVPDLEVNPTAIQVPVFFGFCEIVHVVTREALEPEAAAYLWSSSDGVILTDIASAPQPTPVTDAAQSDAIFISRLRGDWGQAPGLNFWLVADNIRSGAAGNSVRIAEILVRSQS